MDKFKPSINMTSKEFHREYDAHAKQMKRLVMWRNKRILKLRKAGETIQAIADEYELSTKRVRDILIEMNKDKIKALSKVA